MSVPGYELLGELGRGGMGVVYKARDRTLGRLVALKMILSGPFAAAAELARFQLEARLLAQLQHPNIVQIHAFGEQAGFPYLVLEFVEGGSLAGKLDGGCLPVREAAALLELLARVLHHAHQAGIVHRDLKPANVLLTREGVPKVSDFGLAKHLEQPGGQTLSGAILGTPNYMAPEQASGRTHDIGAWTDVYALGATLYECLTGRPPFVGETPLAVIMQVCHEEPLPPRHFRPDLPPDLERICLTCLEKERHRRYAEALALAEDLRRFLAGDPLADRSDGLEIRPAPAGAARRSSWGRGRATIDPARIAIGLLPKTGPDLFGREPELRQLDAAWASEETNLVMLVAFGGVGKSALTHHWLRALARDNYRGARRVYGWSFYNRGTSPDAVSSDVFLESALRWFGDPNPSQGHPWQKGERLAQRVKSERTLLVLDGLEPLQFPPGPREGRLRDEGVGVLLRELAASNPGLCLITTRLRVADLDDYQQTDQVRRIELSTLSTQAGAALLRRQGVEGSEEELGQVVGEFGGHALALTLLGTYLKKAHHGDVSRRRAVSLLGADARQEGHAQRVMESYARWLGPGPELAVLRLVGLFDRPADGPALAAVRAPPVVAGLNDEVAGLDEADWRLAVSNLREARLLAEEHPDRPETLDAHPLVREYFGSQLRREHLPAWREGHNRLYEHLARSVREWPDTLEEMGPLFAAVAHGCKAERQGEVLRDVYRRRLMRGDESFASQKLVAFGPLLSALSHFFEPGNWTRPRNLSESDQVYVLTQAALYLSISRGFPVLEAEQVYRLVLEESSGATPADRFAAIRGLWRCHHVAALFDRARQDGEQLVQLAGQLGQPALVAEAHFALGSTVFFRGEFGSTRRHTESGLAAYGPERTYFGIAGIDVRVGCLVYAAWSSWYLGETRLAQERIDEALGRARDLADSHTLAVALLFGARLAQCNGQGETVGRFSEELIALSAKYGFAHWLASGTFMRGCALIVREEFPEGIRQMQAGLRAWQATDARMGHTAFLGLLGEACAMAQDRAEPPDRPGLVEEGLRLVEQGLKLAGERGERYYLAELFRIKGELLRRVSDPSGQSAVWLQKALTLAQEQGAGSLESRARASLRSLT